MIALKLSPDLEGVCCKRVRIVHKRDAEEGWPYDFDARTLDNLGRGGELPSRAESRSRLASPPTDFKVHNPNVVAPLAESLKEVVALIRAPLNPVRLLEDEDSHVALPRTTLRHTQSLQG